MNSVVRIVLIGVFAVVVFGGVIMLRHGMNPQNVQMPDRSFEELPMRFAEWQGEPTELDPKIFDFIGAEVVVNRNYESVQGKQISVHTAVFTNYGSGAFHNPANCYRSSGWLLLDNSILDLQLADGSTATVSLMTWSRNGERVMVVYWYQLGEHMILSRLDLGKARVALRGSEVWPPLVKVLMQTSANDPEAARLRLKTLAEDIYNWINEMEVPANSDVATGKA